jgi:hypothetical protein
LPRPFADEPTTSADGSKALFSPVGAAAEAYAHARDKEKKLYDEQAFYFITPRADSTEYYGMISKEKLTTGLFVFEYQGRNYSFRHNDRRASETGRRADSTTNPFPLPKPNSHNPWTKK